MRCLVAQVVWINAPRRHGWFSHKSSIILINLLAGVLLNDSRLIRLKAVHFESECDGVPGISSARKGVKQCFGILGLDRALLLYGIDHSPVYTRRMYVSTCQ